MGNEIKHKAIFLLSVNLRNKLRNVEQNAR